MPLSVLIIEDDKNFRRIVELRLKGWRQDLDISVAENLAQAAEALDNRVFDLVIKDQHLPDGLGSEFRHKNLDGCTLLAVSSDDRPDLPVDAIRGGAQHFLGKRQVTEPLFIPLIEALLEKTELQAQVVKNAVRQSRMETITRLVTTLKHEINNPLGAVLGGTYLVKTAGYLDEEQTKALKLIEESGERIKHVLQELDAAVDLEEAKKASEDVFIVPGDKPWTEKSGD